MICPDSGTGLIGGHIPNVRSASYFSSPNVPSVTKPCLKCDEHLRRDTWYICTYIAGGERLVHNLSPCAILVAHTCVFCCYSSLLFFRPPSRRAAAIKQ